MDRSKRRREKGTVWIKTLKTEGYMTVEASVIVPLTFICFLAIIYYTFFLYNHLVVYQSCYIAALRGSRIKNTTSEAIADYVNNELSILLDEQIYQYKLSYKADVNLMSIKVTADTSLMQDKAVGALFHDRELKGEREVEIIRTDPVDYIRNIRRFE
ncbi:MAG: hypothetical protein K6G22_08850 [Lachnospiraceae bacterium]|nr:hypothetical protein [Lachnospiraceae bacterium]